MGVPTGCPSILLVGFSVRKRRGVRPDEENDPRVIITYRSGTWVNGTIFRPAIDIGERKGL